LKQLVDIVKAMTRPKRIIVLGSSSLLAGAPDLGEKGRPLELSLDVDLLVEPCDARQAGVLHEAIGEGSLFHREYGVYADFMRPGIVETFPAGWQKRCVLLDGDRAVRCLSPIDLAIIKLQLGREKDVDLLRALLKAGIISIGALQKAYLATPMNEREMFKAGRILRRLEIECDSGDASTCPVVRESRRVYVASGKKSKAIRPAPVKKLSPPQAFLSRVSRFS
jgi:hypothetical protein